MSSIYDNDYTEIDSSPLGTQQARFLEEYFSPSNFFERHCAENPSAHSCKIYTD